MYKRQGAALWIPPESTRQIRNGDAESAFVLVSAPSIEDDEGDDEWLLSGFAG
ncbi:Cupin 2 conserved barrel domain protein [Halobiforma nitratireducens JCM 10879]|uniref:Cupin 2 conserved barrel domain protein n=1 Tax=Halobiforma nitratireducens JCM 10879 TaxID=1227454 RepID=M0M348_9EURY|nr:Cupin 2 conserved barrel domain protein [Halobiforma nitratireducens JCM 10879]